MEKIIVTPGKVRGLGNVLVKDKNVAYSNVYTEESSVTDEVIDGVSFPVRTLSYVNSLLYFTTYTSRVVPGAEYSFAGVVVDESTGEPLSGATVSLLVDGDSVDTDTSDSDGVVSFTGISFSTAGVFDVQLSYSNVKSGKVVVSCIDPDSISVGDLWLNTGVTTSVSAVVSDEGSVVGGVPVGLSFNGTLLDTQVTDNDGVVRFNVTGTGNDRTLVLSCGSCTQNLNVYDDVYHIHQGVESVASDTTLLNWGQSTAQIELLSEGFRLTPTNNTNSIYGKVFATYEEEMYTPYLFEEGIVEFTYKGGTGTYPLGFRAWKNYNGDELFALGYNSSSGKYNVNVRQSGSMVNTQITSSLQPGDKFKFVFEADTVTVYRNNSVLAEKSYDTNDFVPGFMVNSGCSQTYEDYRVMLLPEGGTTPAAVSLSTTASSVILKNTAVSLTATVYNSGGAVLEGETVSFYNGESLLGTATTNSSGVATYSYTPTSAGSLSLTAKTSNNKVSSAISIRVKNDNNPYSIVLSASSTSVTVNTNVTLSVTVKDSENDPVPNAKIVLNDSSEYVTCDSLGAYSTVVTSASATTSSYVFSSYDYTSVESNTVSVTWSSDAVSSVSLSASSNSIYIDGSAVLTATVSMSDSSTPTGKTVSFYNGSALLGTGTTTDGVATYTYTPSSVGTMSMKAVCETVESSVVSVTVSKKTVALTLSTSSLSVDVGTSFTLSGTLKFNNTGLASQNIEIYDYVEGDLVDTVTTDSEGNFSKTINASSVGNYTYYASYEGTSVYDVQTSDTVSVSIVQPTPTYNKIVMGEVNSKTVLSAYDSDSATFTAQLQDNNDNNVSISGITITFKNGSTTLGTGTTNASGLATCSTSYSAVGAGDLSFTATDGSILSQTYSLEDCEYYNTSTYSSETTVNLPITASTSCKVEFDLIKTQSTTGAFIRVGDDGNNCLQVGLLGSGNYGFMVQHNGSTVTSQYSTNLSNGTFHTVLTYDNGSITYVINNQTKTYNYTQPLTKLLNYAIWNNGTIKNMKIKPLS